MKLLETLGLSVVLPFAIGGCLHSNNVAAVHFDEPGTHIVSGKGAITIAQNKAGQSHVCTRVVSQPEKPRHKPGPGREPGAQLDVLLFRLCEARSNGDISQQQYAASVQSILKSMEAMATRPHMMGPAMRPRDDDGERRQRRWRRGGFGPGPFDGGRESADEPPPSPPKPMDQRK